MSGSKTSESFAATGALITAGVTEPSTTTGTPCETWAEESSIKAILEPFINPVGPPQTCAGIGDGN